MVQIAKITGKRLNIGRVIIILVIMPAEIKIPPKERERVIKRIENKKDELQELLEDLQREMKLINKARSLVKAEKMSFFTPRKNMKFLQEIKVPRLKILKDKGRKS